MSCSHQGSLQTLKRVSPTPLQRHPRLRKTTNCRLYFNRFLVRRWANRGHRRTIGLRSSRVGPQPSETKLFAQSRRATESWGMGSAGQRGKPTYREFSTYEPQISILDQALYLQCPRIPPIDALMVREASQKNDCFAASTTYDPPFLCGRRQAA